MRGIAKHVTGPLGSPLGGAPATRRSGGGSAPNPDDAAPDVGSVFDGTSFRIQNVGTFADGSRRAGVQGDVIWYENMPALFGTGAFSMLAVATVTTFGGGDNVSSSTARDMVNTEYNRVGFRIGTDRVICFVYNGAYRQVYQRIDKDKKYGFLMVADGSNLHFHVSGEATQSTATGSLQYYQELFEIGGGNKNYNNNRPFNGEIHDFAIWKRALSSADLAAMKSETESLHGIQW